MESMLGEMSDEEDLDAEDSDDEIEDNGHIKVYSNCYDGYLNIRAEPTSKSKILGTLPNGPKGAELLGVEGKWSKVRVNGVVGYIWSADVQSTPTDPVYISASDVVGTWEWKNESSIAVFKIKSNGKWDYEFREGDCHDSDYGTWSLSHDKLVLKCSDGSVASFPIKGKKMVVSWNPDDPDFTCNYYKK